MKSDSESIEETKPKTGSEDKVELERKPAGVLRSQSAVRGPAEPPMEADGRRQP